MCLRVPKEETAAPQTPSGFHIALHNARCIATKGALHAINGGRAGAGLGASG
jgi:hypothetical protein